MAKKPTMKHSILFLFILYLLSSCNHDSPSNLKDENGLFICEVVALKNSSTFCNASIKTKNNIPINWATYSSEDGESIFSNTVFLIGETLTCNSQVDFFPLSLIELKSEFLTQKVVVGIAADPKYNNLNISDFFSFQMKYYEDLKAIESWVKKEYNNDWILTKWENDQLARAYLERLSHKF